MIQIEQIAYDFTWPIRQEVMYPDQDLNFVKLENDEIGIHFALYFDHKLTGVVSLFNEKDSYQFRKLAILDDLQKKGFGTKLMEYIIDFCKIQKASKLWCNARVNAKEFYKRLGFQETENTFFKDGYDFVVMELDFNYDSEIT